MTTKITAEQFNAAVEKYRRTRRKNPGRRLANGKVGCVYTTPDGCHCVAGQIMTDLGLKVPVFGGADNGHAIDLLDRTYLGRLTDEMVRSLSRAQRRADEGAEWWKALVGAKVR